MAPMSFKEEAYVQISCVYFLTQFCKIKDVKV